MTTLNVCGWLEGMELRFGFFGWSATNCAFFGYVCKILYAFFRFEGAYMYMYARRCVSIDRFWL